MTRTKKPKRPPTTAKMRAVVQAWLAEHYPDAEHVELAYWNPGGGGETVCVVLDGGEEYDSIRAEVEDPD